MLKFIIDKAKNIDPEITVIARRDGKPMKESTLYLVVNLSKSHGSESYSVLQKHGYHIPEVESFLKEKNQELGKVKKVTLPGSLLKDKTYYQLTFKLQLPNKDTQALEEREVKGEFYVNEKIYSFTHNKYIYNITYLQLQTMEEFWVSEHNIVKYEKIKHDGE
ncbi:MAG: hypothetical protein LCH52_08390 [Bacteroidetes bacterium]|nr:hypothetical protein [Bacteroidota bacterium]